MKGGRILQASLMAPAAASIAAFPAWLLSLLISSSVTLSSSDTETTFGESFGFVFVFLAYGLAVAVASEALVGLPLFFLFRALGWLRVWHFVLGGVVVAIAVFLRFHGWNAPKDVGEVLIVILPAIVGALTFGYVGGWLPNKSFQRTRSSASGSLRSETTAPRR